MIDQKKTMRTTDNYPNKDITSKEFILDIEKSIANRSIGELVKENPDLLIIPPEIGAHDDEIEKNWICSLNQNKLSTYNIMGFIGVNWSVERFFKIS